MSRFITLLAIICLFLCAAVVVQPTSHAITSDVQTFQNDYIMPTETISANFYEPELRVSFNYTFKVTFPPLTPVTKGFSSTGKPQVVEYVNQQPADYLFDYGSAQFQEVNHWANGTITYTPLDKAPLDNERDNGIRLEGWFPSPDQLADYIAYYNGWEFNYVYAASHNYEAQSGNEIPDVIYEQTIENCPVVHNYDDPVMTITQSSGLSKIPGPTSDKNIFQSTPEALCCNITPVTPISVNTSKAPIPPPPPIPWAALVWLAVVIVVCIITYFITDCIVQTDTTPYGLEDLGDARKLGWDEAANESYLLWEARLADLLRRGLISNETYVLLHDANGGVYNDVMRNYINPYDIPQGGSDDWIHTLINVITTAVIIAVCIVAGLCILWLLRKLGIFGKRDNVTTNLTIGSPIRALRDIFTFGLSTGSI